MREQGIRIELPPSTFVIHFGGWKKLQQQAVTKPVLTEHAAEVFGLPADHGYVVPAIVDIYGFTEQLGVIYPDDSQGVKRTPTYAEVLVRDPRTLEVVPDGSPWVCSSSSVLCRTVTREWPCSWTTWAESSIAIRRSPLKSSAVPNGPNRGAAAIP